MFHIQRVQAIRRPTKTHQNALYGQITHNIAWAEHKWICQYDDLAALSSDTEQDFEKRIAGKYRNFTRQRKFQSCLVTSLPIHINRTLGGCISSLP